MFSSTVTLLWLQLVLPQGVEGEAGDIVPKGQGGNRQAACLPQHTPTAAGEASPMLEGEENGAPAGSGNW